MLQYGMRAWNVCAWWGRRSRTRFDIPADGALLWILTDAYEMCVIQMFVVLSAGRTTKGLNAKALLHSSNTC